METSISDGISLGTDLIKIYYIIMEFALSGTDGDFRRWNVFLYTIFIH